MEDDEKEKSMHITIKLKKTLSRDYGVSIENKWFIDANYDGEMAEKTRKKMLEVIENHIIGMDKEIDKKVKK